MKQKTIFITCTLIALFSIMAYASSDTYTYQTFDVRTGEPIECTFVGSEDSGFVGDCVLIGGGEDDDDLIDELNQGDCDQKSGGITKLTIPVWVEGKGCVEAYGECHDCDTAQECQTLWSSCKGETGTSYENTRCIDFMYGNLNKQQCEGGGQRRMIFNFNSFPQLQGITLKDCSVNFGAGTYTGCGVVSSAMMDVGQTYTVTVSFKIGDDPTENTFTKQIYLEPEGVNT